MKPLAISTRLLLTFLILLIVILSTENSANAKALVPDGCCQGKHGNVDGAGIVELVDLSALVSYLTGGGFTPPCHDAADVDGNGTIELRDLSALVNYLTGGSFVLSNCPGVTMPFAERQVAFAAIDSVQKSLAGVSPDSIANALITFLNRRSEFEEYGKDETSVWARFIDGRILVIPNNRVPTALPEGKLVTDFPSGDSTIPEGFTLPKRRFTSWDPTGTAVGQSMPGDNSPLDLPYSTQVLVATTLPTFFSTLNLKATALLGDAGYAVASEATVPGLLGVRGEGLFCLDAHGGRGRARNIISEVPCILTGSIATAATESLYASMLDSNELTYMNTGDFSDKKTRYGFTGKFVAQYMLFAKNSLVLVNACYSNNQTIRAGFAAAGASVYAGWTKPVSDPAANTAGEFLLDRLLGANKSTWVPKENPFQRPFDIDQLYQQMIEKGYDTDTNVSNSKLIVSRLQGNLGVLAPSIATVLVDQRSKIICLFGTFGAPSADCQVTVGGVQLSIQDWGYNSTYNVDTIACAIPDEGPGSAGDVQVKVRNIKSNVTQLSRYKGNITLTHATNDGRQYDIAVNLQIRVDLQPFRLEPGKAPIYNQTTYVVHGDQASTANYTCHGVTNLPSGSTITWSGSGNLTNDIDTADSPKGFKVGAWFDPEHKKVQMYLFGMVENGITSTLEEDGGGTYVVPHTIYFGLDTFDGHHDGYPQYFEMPMDSSFSIVKGSKAALSVDEFFCVPPARTDSVTISWDKITCEYPPNPDAARVIQTKAGRPVK